MIISCPSCQERISNKSKACPHCRLDLSGSGDGLSLDQAEERVRRQLKYKLDMHGYASILMTVAGATWIYFSSDGLAGQIGFWPTACMAAGALWYVSVRVYSVVIKFRD